MRAHIGAALVSVSSFRAPRVGTALTLRSQAGARGAFALACVEPPNVPADPVWWAMVEPDALCAHRELAAALLSYSADNVSYVGSWLDSLQPFDPSVVPAALRCPPPETARLEHTPYSAGVVSLRTVALPPSAPQSAPFAARPSSLGDLFVDPDLEARLRT